MTKTQDKYKQIMHKVPIKKVIAYRSPSGCSSFKLERVNPDHVGFIWGYGKNKNPIKCAKVFFYSFFIASFIGLADVLTNFTFDMIFKLGIGSIVSACIVSCIVYSPMLKEVLCGSIGLKFLSSQHS